MARERGMLENSTFAQVTIPANRKACSPKSVQRFSEEEHAR